MALSPQTPDTSVASVSSVCWFPVLAAMLAIMCIVPAIARAQVKIPPVPSPIGIRAYAVAVEWQRMTASETFDAVTGSSSLIGFGGGVEVLRIAKGIFARLAISLMTAEGTRVAISGDEVVAFDPPIRLNVSLLPVEVGGGWRFSPRPRPGVPSPRVTPYVGASGLFGRYRETSEFDEPGEDAAITFNGIAFFGGVDVGLGGGIFIGGEAQYRIVPDALGEGGASAFFGETDLGGLALRVLIGFRK